MRRCALWRGRPGRAHASRRRAEWIVAGPGAGPAGRPATGPRSGPAPGPRSGRLGDARLLRGGALRRGAWPCLRRGRLRRLRRLRHGLGRHRWRGRRCRRACLRRGGPLSPVTVIRRPNRRSRTAVRCARGNAGNAWRRRPGTRGRGWRPRYLATGRAGGHAGCGRAWQRARLARGRSIRQAAGRGAGRLRCLRPLGTLRLTGRFLRLPGLLDRECFREPSDDWCLDRRRRRPHELAHFLELGHDGLAFNTELFREFVNPDLRHCSPLPRPLLPVRGRACSGPASACAAHRCVLIGRSSRSRPAFPTRLAGCSTSPGCGRRPSSCPR